MKIFQTFRDINCTWLEDVPKLYCETCDKETEQCYCKVSSKKFGIVCACKECNTINKVVQESEKQGFLNKHKSLDSRFSGSGDLHIWSELGRSGTCDVCYFEKSQEYVRGGKSFESDIINKVRQERKDGYELEQIAKKYGISTSDVYDMLYKTSELDRHDLHDLNQILLRSRVGTGIHTHYKGGIFSALMPESWIPIEAVKLYLCNKHKDWAKEQKTSEELSKKINSWIERGLGLEPTPAKKH